MKYQKISLTPEDAQMLATRQFSVEQIARWFGVPPVMIGHAAQGLTTWGSGGYVEEVRDEPKREPKAQQKAAEVPHGARKPKADDE